MTTIGVIEGDGIGREVIPAAVDVLASLTLGFTFHSFDVGADRYLRTGEALPPSMMEDLGQADAILLGAIGDPRVKDPSYTAQTLGRLRSGFDLYANVRPARLFHERLSPLRDPSRRRGDVVVVRENTEGLYTDLGGRLRAGTPLEVALQEHISTYHGVSRVIDYAFSIARHSVVMADKWNAMPHAGGLWQRCWSEVAASHSDVATRHMAVDACAFHLIRDPGEFDVIVTENCFGDILSDVAAAMVGGLGMMPSGSVNASTRRALFEPVHGSAPDIAGKGIANPFAAVLSGAMLLRHLGFDEEAAAVERAVAGAVGARECTADVGGNFTTIEAARAVRQRL